MKKVDIYTDGACAGNPGPGGYGAILIYNGIEKVINGFEPETTNNRMEITAAIEALKCLNQPCEVNLYSDSAYLVNAFQQGWIYSWVKNGWKKSGKGKEEVKNEDLWKELYEMSKMHKINFIKVKGHSDNEYNNRCDKLATDQIKLNSNEK
jgi:ribonuclease HI